MSALFDMPPVSEIDGAVAHMKFGTLPPANLPTGADGTEPQEEEQERHMSNVEAITILAELARKRSRTLAEVEALMMGANRLFHRHFQRRKNWARRRARLAASEEVQA